MAEEARQRDFIKRLNSEIVQWSDRMQQITGFRFETPNYKSVPSPSPPRPLVVPFGVLASQIEDGDCRPHCAPPCRSKLHLVQARRVGLGADKFGTGSTWFHVPDPTPSLLWQGLLWAVAGLSVSAPGLLALQRTTFILFGRETRGMPSMQCSVLHVGCSVLRS